MAINLPSLYHWTPKVNRKSILQHGLRVAQKCIDNYEWYAPWICFATSPMEAWYLLPIDVTESEIEVWDLWEVILKDEDDIKIRSDLGAKIKEVRVHHGLPSDRIRWVGEREGAAYIQ